MNNPNGLFIVIEGTDGSGKTTQYNLLKDRLESAGYDVLEIHFPRYEEPSSYFVREYLSKTYGAAEEVSPYAASLFFSLDRFQAASTIKQAIAEGKIVLCDRYTASNMAHQGTKFDHIEQRRGYFIWLDNLEFQILGLPRPDANFVLSVPYEVIKQRLADKSQSNNYRSGKDIHESSENHIKKSIAVYNELCNLFPKDFTRIDGVRSNQLLSIEVIHKHVWEAIQPLLPSAPSRFNFLKTYTFSVPEKLPADVKKLYQDTFEHLIKAAKILAERLSQHFIDQEDKTPVGEIASAVLPIGGSPSDVSKVAKSLGRADKPLAYPPPLSLVKFSPKDELTLVHKIKGRSDRLNRGQKATMLKRYSEDFLNKKNDGKVLKLARYQWEILSETPTLEKFQSLQLGKVSPEAATPRYGYEVPALLEELELADEFENCFDMSLKLHSTLQSQGFGRVAESVCLRGHKRRWELTHDGAAVTRLKQIQLHDEPHIRQLVQQMQAELTKIHPILAS